MLKLYNKEHVAVGALTELKDYKTEYLLSGEDLVEFSLSRYDENIHLVEEEGYVRTKHNEYVIKAIDPSDNFKRFECIVNVEDIKAKSIKSFDTSNNTVTEIIRLAIAGTGWILSDNNITKRRTVRVQKTNALEVLREVRKVFRIDFRFDAINKVITAYEQLGSDRGVYFSDELNLRALTIPSDTYDYATKLFAYGKDGLNIASVNGGKEYVENYQYSNKVIELILEDNRYTDATSLKVDAEAKLEELSKPKMSYQASVADLAKLNPEYAFLDFFLGDTVTLLSKTEKFRDKQRIVKYIEYPNEVDRNTCELGNTTLTFEELQKENEAKNQAVDNITSDNGTIDGSKVDNITTEQISDFEASVGKITDLTVINAKIENLEATNVTITGELNVVKASIGTLNANVANIDKLVVNNTAEINNLIATSATITDLNATNATIGTLQAEVGKINTLVSGNISSENIQTGGITGSNLNMKTIFVEDANIITVNANKINVGELSTNKVKIKSDDGGIEIVGATQQFKDKNNRVRIQMGQDAQGNFNFIIRGEDGTSTLIDHTGIKEKAITDDLIKNNMIASDAVGEKQINYSSFSSGFNKDTNTTTLKATKVKLDNQNQTLEVAFNAMKSTTDGHTSTLSTHTTQLNVQQGKIDTLIQDTTITQDGQTLKLKDEYSKTVQTVNGMSSTVGSHTTQINEATGKITGVETRVNVVERDLDSITARVSSTETNVNTVTSTAKDAQNKANTNITEISKTNNKVSVMETSLNSITSRVSNVETTSLENFNNLLINSNIKESVAGWRLSNLIEGKSLNRAVTSAIIPDRNCIFIGDLKDNTAQNRYMDSTKFAVAKGEKISISLHAMLTEFCGDCRVYLLFTDNTQPIETDNSFLNGYKAIVITEKTWKKYTLTDVAPEGATRCFVRIRYNSLAKPTAESNNRFALASIMVNRGDKYPTWTSNTEDNFKFQESRLKEAEQKITDDAITNTVKKSFYTKSETDGQITSKGYQTASQVQQTVGNLEIKFSESGGYNLLRNSSFKNDTNLWQAWDSKDTMHKYTYANSNCVRFLKRTTLESNTLGARYVGGDINIVANRYYTLSFKMRAYSNITPDKMTYNYFIHSDGNLKMSSQDNYTFDYQAIGNGYYKINISFKCNTVRNGCGLLIGAEKIPTVSGETGFGVTEIILQEGKIPGEWAPHPSEVYDGITTIDKDGIKVSQSNISTTTTMNANGFYINKSGKGDIFKVDANGLYIDAKIKSDEVIMANGGMYTGQAVRGTNSGGFVVVGSTGDATFRADTGQVYLQTNNEVKVTAPSNPNLFKNLRANDIYANNDFYATRDATINRNLNVNGEIVAVGSLTSNGNVHLGNNGLINIRWGYGVVRVNASGQPLYLQCQDEIKCTKTADASTYIGLRAQNLMAQNKVYANGVALTSNREYKKNIENYSEDALYEICTTPIRQYHLLNDLDNELKRIGIILQEAPLNAIDIEGTGVELYQMVAMSWKAIQQLKEMIESLI